MFKLKTASIFKANVVFTKGANISGAGKEPINGL